MVGLAVLVPLAGFLGLLTSMVSDGCTDDTLRRHAHRPGVFTSALSPVVVFLVALVWVVVRWRRRRSPGGCRWSPSWPVSLSGSPV